MIHSTLASAGAAALQPCDPDRPPDDECVSASWFDSSLDLRDGLQVIEYPSLAAMMRALGTVCAVPGDVRS